jgi:dienelactone hydrolase
MITMKPIIRMMSTALCLVALVACTGAAAAEGLQDLSAGQSGRLQLKSSNPESLWTLLRGDKGPEVAIAVDLLLPPEAAGSKVPAVVLSHGSEGVSSLYYDVWAKALLAEGYAVLIVDSFTGRGVNSIRGTTSQLTWNTTRNVSDALHSLKLLDTHPNIDGTRIFHMGWSRGELPVLTTMWPTLQATMLRPGLRWAGSIAVYPGCNLRWRFAPEQKITAPVLFLLGEADDMTPAAPCSEYASRLASDCLVQGVPRGSPRL